MERNLSRALAIAVLCAALPLPAHAQEADVPLWAEGWKYIWLDASQNGSLRLSAKLTSPVVPTGGSELFAVVEVSSINFPQERRPPVNAAIVVDTSASMHGNRLRIVKKAAADLIDTLAPTDRLAIVRVNDEPDVLESQPCTVENKRRMREFIEEATGMGGSDLSAGMADGYEQIVRNKGNFTYHRVVVVSDGHPNKGMADPDGLADIARRMRESENIHTAALTIGRGSDADLMHGISDAGWGFSGDLQDDSHEFRVGRRVEVDLLRRAGEKVSLKLAMPSHVLLLDVLEYAGEASGDNQISVDLHELAQKETLRVLVRLSVSAEVEGPMDVLSATLKYHDGLVDKDRETSLKVQARASRDPREIEANVDPKMLLVAAHALASRAMAQALDRVEANFPEQARELLADARRYLRRATEVSGIVTEDDVAAIDRLERELFPSAATKGVPRPGKSKAKKVKRRR